MEEISPNYSRVSVSTQLKWNKLVSTTDESKKRVSVLREQESQLQTSPRNESQSLGEYSLNYSQEEELVSYNLVKTNPHYSRVEENKVHTTLKWKNQSQLQSCQTNESQS